MRFADRLSSNSSSMAGSTPQTLDEATEDIIELVALHDRVAGKARNNIVSVICNKIRSLRTIQATHRDLLNRLVKLQDVSVSGGYYKTLVAELILGVTEDMLAENVVGSPERMTLSITEAVIDEDGADSSITTGVCRHNFVFLLDLNANKNCS